MTYDTLTKAQLADLSALLADVTDPGRVCEPPASEMAKLHPDPTMRGLAGQLRRDAEALLGMLDAQDDAAD